MIYRNYRVTDDLKKNKKNKKIRSTQHKKRREKKVNQLKYTEICV